MTSVCRGVCAAVNDPASPVEGVVTLSSGLPDRYRIPAVGVIVVVSTAGLFWLAYKIRTADPGAATTQEPSGTLERRDLMADAKPENTFEWLITVANRPLTYGILDTVFVGLGLLSLALGGVFQFVGWILLFGAALFLIQTFLRFGWPRIEVFYERRKSGGHDPDSMRFQGFSQDTMIFLTLIAAMVVGLTALLALEMVLS